MALTIDNQLYGWGENAWRQLGSEVTNNYKLNKPILIQDLSHLNIKQIECGSGHTLILTSEGMVYAWGANNYGQVGCGEDIGDIDEEGNEHADVEPEVPVVGADSD